jgi:uncharacterized protein (TIGR00299 family) protein
MSTPDPGMRTAWFNCCAGVAGDMLLAALVDAGAEVDAIADAVAALGVDGYALLFERVQRCGVGATWTNLVIHHEPDRAGGTDHDHDHDHGHEHPHRPAREVLALIQAAELPERVKDRALRAYRALAEVEGAIHGVPADEVELHEVGALDSIIDVVGVCAALESLGVHRIICSPIAVGHGTVDTAHGRLPNPVPAVVELMARAGAPVVGLDTTMEVATPTGVALMTALADAFGAMPAMQVHANGFGAGTADPPGRPNVVQAVIGSSSSADPGSPAAHHGRPALLVEANVDDVTGEVVAHTIAHLLAAGAHDAWATPIVMKKGRPAQTVHALCDEARLGAVSAVLIDETGTLGVRATRLERWPQQREDRIIEIDGHQIRVKVGTGRVKVEHDDAVRVATALGLPLREVLRRAGNAAEDHHG